MTFALIAMTKLKSNSAQQIIEALLLFAAVIVVLVLFIGPSGPFWPAVQRIISGVLDQIGKGP